MNERHPILQAKGITKRFGVHTVLDRVDFELIPGEVHALTGENGAGKSTLAKIFAGVHRQDDGEIVYEGRRVNFSGTREAMDAGISIVLQEFNLIPDLSVAENLFLGNESYYWGNVWVRKKQMVERTYELLGLFGMQEQIDPQEKVRSLSVAEMQMVEILKAVSIQSRVILLDEPTAALSSNEVERLFRLIRQLQKQQVAFVIVTHRFEEIYEISDRITVLRDGKLVKMGIPASELPREELVKAMVGRDIRDLYGRRLAAGGASRGTVLEVKHLSDAAGKIKDVSFSVAEGEVLGIVGLVGSGRTELLRCVFGADRAQHGEVLVRGKPLTKKGIKASIAAGMAFVTEDRKQEGLLTERSVFFNLSLVKSVLDNRFILRKKAEKTVNLSYKEKLNIKMADGHMPVKSLSGGNQQKVVLAKWLMTKPSVLLLDEPTRGIDIAAKAEIYAILNQLAASGVGIVMVSSELPEVLGMCDRILVMRDGRVVKELMRSEADEETILRYASYESSETETGRAAQ